jgi:hypothetical protein
MQIRDDIARRPRLRRGVARPSGDVGPVVAADAREGGDLGLDVATGVASPSGSRLEDHGWAPRASAGQEELPPSSHIERSRIGAGHREIGGRGPRQIAPVQIGDPVGGRLLDVQVRRRALRPLHGPLRGNQPSASVELSGTEKPVRVM